MKKSSRDALLALLVITLVTSGCAYHYKFKTKLPPDTTAEAVTEWKHIALWGWVVDKPFNLEEACPQGVAEFGSYVSLPNWLCALLTVGLYSPRTAYAIPAKAKAVGGTS